MTNKNKETSKSPPEQKKKKQKQHKVVTFANTTDEIPSGRHNNNNVLTQEECNNRWYSRTELDELYLDVKHTCKLLLRQSRSSISSCDNNNNNKNRPTVAVVVSDESDSDENNNIQKCGSNTRWLITSNDDNNVDNICQRGFERVISIDRQRNKLLAERAILRAQEILKKDTSNSDEIRNIKLSNIAIKLNKYSTSIALSYGQQDCIDAYYPKYMKVLPKPIHIESFPLKGKQEQQQQRDESSPSMITTTFTNGKRCLPLNETEVQPIRNVRHRIR